MSKLRDPILIFILLFNLALGASILTRGSEWGDDFASYIMQAQSILNGDMDEFIEHNTFTIFESSFQIGPVAYPWGYPLALTPVLLLKGVHVLALKLPGLFFFTGFLICLYLLMETRLTRTESLLIVSLFAFNPTLVEFLDYIISDIPFLFSVFLALLLVTKLDQKQMIWKQVILGATIFFSFFIRTTGIILLVSFLAFQTLLFFHERTKRRTIALYTVTVVAIFILLSIISSLIFPNGQGAYFHQLAGFTFETLSNNIGNYFFLFVQFFDANTSTTWIYIYYFLVVFFLVGAWVRRNTDHILLIYFALYFFVMIVWPEWQGIRFIFPLIPIFIYFSFQGMKSTTGKMPKRYYKIGKGVIYFFWIVLVGFFMFNTANRAYSNLKDDRRINGPFDPFSTDMFNYIKEETSPDSVVVFFKPRAMRLFTDRDSIMILECENLLKGDFFAQHKKWEYSQILPGELEACSLSLENVFENNRFIVYKVSK